MSRSAAILVLTAVVIIYAIGIATRGTETTAVVRPLVTDIGRGLAPTAPGAVLLLDARDLGDAAGVASPDPTILYCVVRVEAPRSGPGKNR
jgi:hypothetical protein